MTLTGFHYSYFRLYIKVVPGQGATMSVAEGVHLTASVGVDDVHCILTHGYQNLRGRVKVQKDYPLLLPHRALEWLARHKWIVKLHVI